MAKITFITRQKEFAEDADTALCLSGGQFALQACSSVNLKYEIANILSLQPDILIVSVDAMLDPEMKPQIDKIFEAFPAVPTFLHEREEDEKKKALAFGIPSIGVCDDVSDLIDLFEKVLRSPESYAAADKQQKTVKTASVNKRKQEKEKESVQIPQKQDGTQQEKTRAVPEESGAALKNRPPAARDVIRETQPLQSAQPSQQVHSEDQDNQAQQEPETDVNDDDDDIEIYDEGNDSFETLSDDDLEIASDDGLFSVAPDEKSAMGLLDDHPDDNEESETGDDKEPDFVEEQIEKSVMANGKTKVVTVYSAKGGVGKTKVSSELADLLALAETRGRRFRVCEVDCNIDYGDVRTTLGIPAAGPNMAQWASEINERINNGHEKPDSIIYTKKEIEERLRKTQSGLYVLTAPLTNEDSLIINETNMRVMLHNLIQAGEFDFIICDTGNNTRDSTLIALALADEVLLLMTQDVNAASCNSSFLRMMKQVDFDVSKIRLVVNKVKPAKATRISVEDISSHFSDYPTIAEIRYDPEVEISTNIGHPLAETNPDMDFTRQIRKIVSYLTGDTGVKQAPKKQPFLHRLFHRKQGR